MKKLIKVFNKKEVQVFLINNEPYFLASDICNVLELKNVSRALSTLRKDDITQSKVIDSIGRKVDVIVINEKALYRLIFKSKKEEAKTFQDWIFDDVIPSIRKTGKYSIPDEIKKMSTKNRNSLTSEWQLHGIDKPHQFIQLILQEYKSLNIDKKKSEMNKHELLLLNALESMEMLRLFENQDINGYYECRDSLIETSKQVPTKLKGFINEQ